MSTVSYRGPNPLAADASAVAAAAAELAAGRLVALPTETVYGLGADAGSRDAVARIYRLKGRPADHPLIVHVTGAEQARRWARWDARAQALADAFWPGPLTVILVRLPEAPAWACGGQDTVGLRAPAHPVARALLQAFERLGGAGVAAPSANRFGRVSPTRAGHVIDDLGADAPMVLDGGACEVGVESTIVDLSRGVPVLLRPGGIDAARIEAVLGERLHAADAAAPRASGTLAAHYAPRTPVEMLATPALAARIDALVARGLRVAVWSRARPDAPAAAGQASTQPAMQPSMQPAHWEPMPADPEAMAHRLYDTLRRLDLGGFDRLLIEAPPGSVEAGAHAGRWAAIADRLRRAAAGARPTD